MSETSGEPKEPGPEELDPYRNLELYEKMNLPTVQERNLALSADYEWQTMMMRKFGIANPGDYMIGHYHVVETDPGKYCLKPRENPVVFSSDDRGRAQVIAFLQRTKTETLGSGFNIKGHPDPATARRLVENELCQSVEPGEIAAWDEGF